MSKNIGVVLAGGKGTRFGQPTPKQYFEINGRMIIEYTLEKMEKSICDAIYIIMDRESVDSIGAQLQENFEKVVGVIPSSESRTASIFAFAKHVADDDRVVFTDAVRPFVSAKTYSEIFSILGNSDTDVVKFCTPIVDYLVRTQENEEIYISTIENRWKYKLCKAPVGYKGRALKIGQRHLQQLERTPESDLEVALAAGMKIRIYESVEFNYKITYWEDVQIAERLL